MSGKKRLLHSAARRPEKQTHSARRINQLIPVLNGSRKELNYLEIGVRGGTTIEDITASSKVGVEPHPLFRTEKLPRNTDIFIGFSDQYFGSPDNTNLGFDVIFIDGLHTFDQVYRDFLNSTKLLNPGGIIVLDDTVPFDYFASINSYQESLRLRKLAGVRGSHWSGDVWRLVWAIERFHKVWDFRTVIDGGPPQTILWRQSHYASESVADLSPEIDVEEVIPGQADYTSLFSQGIPGIFRPMFFQTFLQEFERTVRF